MPGRHFNWIQFEQAKQMLLFVCIETTEYKQVKLRNSHTMILP